HHWLPLLLLVPACATVVTPLEETDLCPDGGLRPNGQPVVTGDACYDAWAADAATTLSDYEAALAEAVDHCAAIAEASGAPEPPSGASPGEVVTSTCAVLETLSLPADAERTFSPEGP